MANEARAAIVSRSIREDVRSTERSGMSARYDFPQPTQPRTFYVIASTPRSGSSFLCRALWATGSMGMPDEYFNYHGPMLRLAARLTPKNIHEYIRLLLELRTSPNGVFGFKAQWRQFHVIGRDGLIEHFPDLRYVYLQRSDRLAQAVSLAIATMSGQWISTMAARGEPVYDADLIRRCLTRIEEETGGWQKLFRGRGIEPLSLTYESLAADPDANVRTILQHLGVTPDPAFRAEAAPIQRQSDSRNREWIERFREENPDFR